jgi:hypothetical protein
MALRMSPTSKRDKERLRQLQLRRKEQDYKGNKEVACVQGTRYRII